MTTDNLIPTTAIGSLPHHNIDSAIETSFRLGIPFLPQIPIRNPWEFMIGQALEGIPGLQADQDGSVSVNLDVWNSRTHLLATRLQRAFSEGPEVKDAFESFEPSPLASSCWQPFVWELEERETKIAKIQIAGPMTAQWAVRLSDGSSIDKHADLSSQIFRLVLARALAMTRRLQAGGIQPLLFLDEPSLYGLGNNPKHILGMQELKTMVQILKKEGVVTGIHCCSNTDWNQVLELGPSCLSLDTELSLENLFSEPYQAALDLFLEQGGRLALGVIPSARSAVLHSLNLKDLETELLDMMQKRFAKDKVRKVLREAIFTPACGLALHSVPDAELILTALTEFYQRLKKTVYN